MNKKIALKYVIGAFCILWLFAGTIMIANHFGYLKAETPLYYVLFFFACIALPICAFTLLLKNKVMPAKQLFKTMFNLKQPFSMYLLTIGFLILYFGVGTFVNVFEFKPLLISSLLMFPIMIIGGGVEEVGWRFILQPALESKFPFAIAAFIFGIIWSVWHLPLWLIEGTGQSSMNFGLFAIGSLGIGFVLSAIYRISKSVWLCVFFHALINSLYTSFPDNISSFDTSFVPTIILAVVLMIAATLLVMIKESGGLKLTSGSGEQTLH